MKSSSRGSVLKQKKPRKNGFVTEIYARITWTEGGKQKERRKKAASITHARELIREMQREIEEHGLKPQEKASATFGEFAKYFEETYLIPPIVRGGRVVQGLRAYKDCRSRLAVLVQWFGKMKLQRITPADLHRYKAHRLSVPHRGAARGVTGVNRELALLRRAFNFAIENDWMTVNPFKRGGKLIESGAEKHRVRVVSREEEAAILGAVENANFRDAVIVAIDTGLRRNELRLMRPEWIDFSSGRINVPAEATKAFTARVVPLTPRAALALKRRLAEPPPSGGVFFHWYNWWKRVQTKGVVDDIHWHDFRHTFATRLAAMGLPETEIQRLLGHKTFSMTYRYTNLAADALDRAARLLDRYDKEGVG